jgi:hypothetical protein
MSDAHSVFIPMTFRRIGGRKSIIFPDGANGTPRARSPVEDPLIKAIARAHRWQRLLEGGQVSSLADIARGENISLSFVSRVYRLVLLAPDIVEAILEGRLPEGLTLNDLFLSNLSDWPLQRRQLIEKQC